MFVSVGIYIILFHYMIVGICISVSLSSIYCSLEEYNLLEFLFRKYNRIVRPVQDHNQHVEVRIGVALNQIIDLVNTV